jgi:hypothetical protein
MRLGIIYSIMTPKGPRGQGGLPARTPPPSRTPIGCLGVIRNPLATQNIQKRYHKRVLSQTYLLYIKIAENAVFYKSAYHYILVRF